MKELYQTTVESLTGVLPIVLFLLAFNKFILRSPLQNPKENTLGIVLAIIGLVLFSNGLRMGLLPLGETVGLNLPKESPLWLVLVFSFILGFGVTMAEPSMQSLAGQVEELTAGILRKPLVMTTVALGIGTGVTLGVLKIVLQIPNSHIIIPALAILALLAWRAPTSIIGVAFDASGVTTGPVTVPLVVALGIGIATALGGRDPLTDGFGIIALCLFCPTIYMLLLGIIYKL
ncbi:MAG: DUF1538 domain-containing protein [Firmicutes bacterium]|nr:DUF1538 domain-containing protein [Bacillota bacterium]